MHIDLINVGLGELLSVSHENRIDVYEELFRKRITLL